MCILMPEHIVRKEMKKLYPDGIDLTDDNSDISQLASKFQVSTNMMLVRLGQIITGM